MIMAGLHLNHESPLDSRATSKRRRVSNIHGCQTHQPGVTANPSKSRVDEYQTIRVTRTNQHKQRNNTTEQVMVSSQIVKVHNANVYSRQAYTIEHSQSHFTIHSRRDGCAAGGTNKHSHRSCTRVTYMYTKSTTKTDKQRRTTCTAHVRRQHLILLCSHRVISSLHNSRYTHTSVHSNMNSNNKGVQ